MGNDHASVDNQQSQDALTPQAAVPRGALVAGPLSPERILSVQPAAGNTAAVQLIGRRADRSPDLRPGLPSSAGPPGGRDHSNSIRLLRAAVAARTASGPRQMMRSYEEVGEPGRRPNLDMGDTGPGVALLQSLVGVKQTSVFDDDTRKAVIAFQEEKLGPGEGSGGVGPRTWQALDKLVADAAQAKRRKEIQAVADNQVRASWATRKDDFLAVAADPSNALNAHQMYQIWMRYWVDRQHEAYPDAKRLEEALRKQDPVAFLEKKPKFDAGKRGVFPADYEAAADRLAAANYYSSYLVGVHDWLEIYVDGMGKRVTIYQVNEKAVELIKAHELHMAILGFVIVIASTPVRESLPSRPAPPPGPPETPGEAGEPMAPPKPAAEELPAKAPENPPEKAREKDPVAAPAQAPRGGKITISIVKASPPGPGAEYGAQLGQRLKIDGKVGPSALKPIVEDLNGQSAMSNVEKGNAAKAAVDASKPTFGAGPVVELDGHQVVLSRLPVKGMPVIVVKPDATVTFGRVDVVSNDADFTWTVSNLSVR